MHFIFCELSLYGGRSTLDPAWGLSSQLWTDHSGCTGCRDRGTSGDAIPSLPGHVEWCKSEPFGACLSTLAVGMTGLHSGGISTANLSGTEGAGAGKKLEYPSIRSGQTFNAEHVTPPITPWFQNTVVFLETGSPGCGYHLASWLEVLDPASRFSFLKDYGFLLTSSEDDASLTSLCL